MKTKQTKRKVPKRLRKLFPNVVAVRDATKTIDISVEEADAQLGRKKDPSTCALARSCVRQKIADSAVIGVSYSYLIKDNIATRYKTSVAVGREITSFDRHQDFAAGQHYKLSKVSPSNRIGKPQKRRGGSDPKPHAVHHTANIRVMKQYKD